MPNSAIILGCGPVGLLAQKFAWLKGAKRVIAIDHVDYRLEHARKTNNFFFLFNERRFQETPECPAIEIHTLGISLLVQERGTTAVHLVIMGIGTTVPSNRLHQQDALLRLKEALNDDPALSRWANRIFAHCGVNTRFTCEPNLLEPAGQCRYVPASPNTMLPTTEDRMMIYRIESVPLAKEAAKKALADSNVRPDEITHLLTVSCTGMFLPGIDAELVWELDLPADVIRIPLTFMGCAAGLSALREARRIVLSDPSARVLVVTIELCSIHIQPSFEKEHLFTAAFFGDGASSCVVGMTDSPQKGGFTMVESEAILFPGSADKMKWTIGNYGFRLQLSPQIPQLIAEFVPSAFKSFWGKDASPELWAIHPGGRAIIDTLETAFSLTGLQTEASRSVLRDYGNMSSATILFVLEELRKQQVRTKNDAATGIALAFGPGVTAEFMRFTYQA
ncbi:type III polyketide synthase [Cohnella yongneupensis]|uniref:Type III polyketide synthase n=1 Tax=Cohnella yongneupensis TaxID=425006 RepID=A0ABW0QSH1_9BACL